MSYQQRAKIIAIAKALGWYEVTPNGWCHAHRNGMRNLKSVAREIDTELEAFIETDDE